jgi:hypothetical protein
MTVLVSRRFMLLVFLLARFGGCFTRSSSLALTVCDESSTYTYNLIVQVLFNITNVWVDTSPKAWVRKVV